MDVRNISVKDLIPYDRNTKKHDKTQINNVAESIKQYGFVQPIVIDKDNVVVIGHCRLLAAKQLKLKEVPCVCVDDLTEEQVKALRIVDNKSNESEWDFDLLADELEELDFDGFDFDFGFEVNGETEGVSYISELLEDEECMTNNGNLERDEFSVSFCFPKEYEEYIKQKIKEQTKEFYQQEIMKIMGVI